MKLDIMRSYEIKTSFWHVYEYATPIIGKYQEVTDIAIYQSKILDEEHVDIMRGLMALLKVQPSKPQVTKELFKTGYDYNKNLGC